MKTISALIHEGPSKLNGEPIIVYLTGLGAASTNKKTGPMVQAWILLKDRSPMDAINKGEDSAICGDCSYRWSVKGNSKRCYVVPFQGPTAAYSHYRRGGFIDARKNLSCIAGLLQDKSLRIGAYGDPAAAPVRVWKALSSMAKSHTGYTHQWRRAPYLKPYCMASVDSEAEREEACRKGWRSYRVYDKARPQTDEIVCPATPDGGMKTKCADCNLCAGLSSTATKSIVAINVFGRKLQG